MVIERGGKEARALLVLAHEKGRRSRLDGVLGPASSDSQPCTARCRGLENGPEKGVAVQVSVNLGYCLHVDDA